MRDGTRLGLLALATAALLGLLGDLLLRAIPWGLNAPLWMLALVVGAGPLVYQARLPLLGEGRWLALVGLAFAGGIALRDSPVLLTVNLLAALLTLGLAGHRASGGWPRIGGLPQYVGALLSAGFHACVGALVLAIYDMRWKDVPRTGWTVPVLATLRGLLIAIPLVMVFGALFMAADAVFSGLVTNLFAIDVRALFWHLFWIGIWSWLTAGFLRQLVETGGAKEAPDSGDAAIGMGGDLRAVDLAPLLHRAEFVHREWPAVAAGPRRPEQDRTRRVEADRGGDDPYERAQHDHADPGQHHVERPLQPRLRRGLSDVSSSPSQGTSAQPMFAPRSGGGRGVGAHLTVGNGERPS